MGTIKEWFNFSQWDISSVDIGVIVGYFVVMLVVGWICKGISKNISDYVRMGNKSTWWLMGTSIFMMMTSAGTFTGGPGQAYLSGWSFVMFGAGSLFGYLFMAAFFAPWMRRTRAVTPPDAIRLRYGPIVEQIQAYIGSVGGMLWGGMFLYTFGTFMAVVFGVPVPTVIVIAGIVVIIYSVSGGSWSVQITDTLQAYILVPIALVVLFLSLKEVGWFSGLQEGIAAKGLQDDYKILMEMGHTYSSKAAKVQPGYYTIWWLGARFLYSFILAANMTACWRFLSVKSDRDARKAAVFAAILLFFGAAVWCLPGMVGRIKYEAEIDALAKYTKKGAAALVEKETAATQPTTQVAASTQGAKTQPATQVAMEAAAADEPLASSPATAPAIELPDRPKGAKLNNPADGAYAIVAKNILPPGLLGLVVIGLFAATMSSLDSSLTGNAGIVTKNLYPPLMRLFGKTPWTGKKLVRLTQAISFLLGCWAMVLAMLLWKYTGEMSVFDVGQEIISLISAPMVAAMVLSFFVPWLPWWAPLFAMAVGLPMSVFFKFSSPLVAWLADLSWLHPAISTQLGDFGRWVGALMWHERIFFNMAFTIIPAFSTIIFWHTATPEYRRRVENFFKQIHTPVDFKKEVGEAMDHTLMKIIGILGLVIAGAICILIPFSTNDEGQLELESVLGILFVSGSVALISTIMLIGGLKAERKLKAGPAGGADASSDGGPESEEF